MRFSKNVSTPEGTDELESGADRVRTDGLRLAKPALSQLSYSPDWVSMFRSGGGPGQS